MKIPTSVLNGISINGIELMVLIEDITIEDQYGSNRIYSPIGCSGNQCSSWIRYAEDCNQINERSGEQLSGGAEQMWR